MVRALDSWSGDRELLGNDCGENVNIHVPLSPSSIIWYRPSSGDSLRLHGQVSGNRIGLAPHWPYVTDSMVYPATGSKAGDEHIAYVSGHAPFAYKDGLFIDESAKPSALTGLPRRLDVL